jgi:hypothetical protein
MTARLLRERTEANQRKRGTYAVSVWAIPGLDADGICRAARECGDQYLPHSDIQASTVEAVEEAGCYLDPLDPPGHYGLTFSGAPTDQEIAAVMSAFSEKRPNPVARIRETQ